MHCFDCNRDVEGDMKVKCKQQGHDLDYNHSTNGFYEYQIIKSDKKDDETKKPQNNSQKLLEFINPKIIKIAISQNDSDKCFALIKLKDHFETIELGSSRSIDWLKSQYYDETKEILSDESYKSAIGQLEANTRFSEKIPIEQIYKRIAFVNGEIYYDLCTPDWKLVRITRDYIGIISHGQNTPMFQRTNSQTQQAEPCFSPTGDPLEEFCKLVRMPNNTLFLVHVISTFIENIPSPIMVISGQQGSVKSTLCSMIKRIVDPSGLKIEDNLSHFPKTVDDLNIHLASNTLVSFDNASYFSGEVSDVLCKAVTGAAYPKRKLYTDSDEIILKFQRKIIINGISPNLDNGDLVERSIQYFTQKIPANERLTSDTVERKFKRLLSDLLGQIFLVLQKALVLYDDVKSDITNLPRMADFVVWGEAISQALGNQKGVLVQDYKKSMEQSNEILNENSPIVAFIDQELGEKDEITLTASEFHGKLYAFAQSNHYDTHERSFPKGPNRLRTCISRIKPSLDEVGLEVEFVRNTAKGHTKNSTLVKIRKQVNQPHHAHLLVNLSTNHGEPTSESIQTKNMEANQKYARGEGGEPS